MTMPPPQDSSKPSVGDLLRLKRMERPPEHFWSTFDRRLQRNLVQAVVCRPRWWQRVGAWLLRPGLGLAAAAASFAVVFWLSAAAPFSGGNAIQSAEYPAERAPESSSPEFPFAWAAVEDRSFAIEVLSSEATSPSADEHFQLTAMDAPRRGGELLTLAMTMEGRSSRTVHY